MEGVKGAYLIIGNGVAGMTAAEEIRKCDKDAQVTIIGDERVLTYYRVKLSHFISKHFQIKELLIHDENWYRERNIELILGERVQSIHPNAQKVFLESGKEVGYHKLLLANGSSSFIPSVEGAKKDGVFALRNLRDLEEIQAYLLDCKEVAVIGGGLLGLEAAWALKERGLRVNVVEFFPYLLPRQLDPELARYVKEQLEQKGLKIYLTAETQEIIGTEKVEGIALKDGRVIPTDMVLFSTGVKPNISIAESTDIDKNRGIKVNAFMETSVANIYAAGDVAEFGGMAMGLWSVASDQGKVAGRSMVGVKDAYTLPQPATLLSIGGFNVFSVGEVNGEKQGLTFREGTVFHKLFIEEGKLIGGVLTGDIKKMAVLKKAVTQKTAVQGLLEVGLTIPEILEKL
ncbi:NAD(P)/FAD-dependent oxidoreductase [Geosporobacter ferrireducens]|uniref:NAD(P)/FAD-dependent oxidoreductase n=1 Tax=Geosporobacter ferrireducens TaxID=1424294 RepID=UPI00139B733D|nr:FAD-dependent oxidoreductase [Geosporobacter ferrireducens]MTI57107.1 NAD(P)/FAD-dependent oxidoreductase [Geosporobacter ferrireducens]